VYYIKHGKQGKVRAVVECEDNYRGGFITDRGDSIGILANIDEEVSGKNRNEVIM
jgi:hypothetical protein